MEKNETCKNPEQKVRHWEKTQITLNCASICVCSKSLQENYKQLVNYIAK